MHARVDIDSEISDVNCTLIFLSLNWEVFKSMRFLFGGYAAAATIQFALWMYGVEQTSFSIALQVWLGGAVLGVFFAWRWFVQDDGLDDQIETRQLNEPLVHPRESMDRGISVARNSS